MTVQPEAFSPLPWFLGEGESPETPECRWLIEDPVAYCRGAFRSVGPVFLTRYRGETWVAMTGPESNEVAFKNADYWSFEKAVPGFREELGHQHVTQLDGRPHVLKRKLLKPAFTMEAVARHVPVLALTAREIMAQWPTRGEFNVFPELLKLLLQFNSRTMLKCELSPEWMDKLTRFEEDLMFGINASADRAQYFADPEYAPLKREVFDFLDGLLAPRLAGKREDDNLQAILDANQDSSVTAEELRYDAYLLLIAGIENVSKLILKIVERLESSPVWKERVKLELDAYRPDSFVRGLSSFPSLRAVIQETERLHPISIMLMQYSAREFEFAGHRIPAETKVLHGHTLPHFLEEIYTDPFEFRPQRWLEQEPPKKFHTLFGAGAHTCLGMNIARLHTPIVLAEWYRSLHLRLCYVPDFTNRLGDGLCQVRPVCPVAAQL
jgi:cytochrome P450